MCGVYPRPRGGAELTWALNADVQGLSPPTRGSPSGPRLWCSSSRVYPRPRGGASMLRDSPRICAGLSPPTRGSQRGLGCGLGHPGSIPAHAGEPSADGSCAATTRVYPRPRGGARRSGHHCRERQVYPRPRGGAYRGHSPPMNKDGLSPPTRGSRSSSTVRFSPSRSIPAHAGEPLPGGPRPCAPAVYPRPRGGAVQCA